MHRGANVSSLDPMANFAKKADLMANSLRTLIIKYSTLPYLLENKESFNNSLAGLLRDNEVLTAYNTILINGMKLILDHTVSIFRFSVQNNFTTCIMNIHSKLSEYSDNVQLSSNILNTMLHSFEQQFQSNYDDANCNILKYDRVHDLLSFTTRSIAASPIRLKDVVKRNYFLLSVDKFQYNDILVEIFQLANGQLAIFHVSSGELPYTSDARLTILSKLKKGNYELLNLGRTLLFSTIKQNDLVIISVLPVGFSLQTQTGNNVILNISCLDAIQWESNWKLCFQRLFDGNKITTYKNETNSLKLLNPFSHTSQKFNMKAQKLEELRPKGNQGAALFLPSPKEMDKFEGREEASTLFFRDFTNKKPISHLHRSQPLPSLSVGSRNNDLSPIPLIKDEESAERSFDEMESLIFDKLLELDKSMKIVLSPMSLEDTMEEMRTVSTSSSMEIIDELNEQSGEISDLESVVSEMEKEIFFTEQKEIDNNDNNINSFNLDVEAHQPSFYSSKSSSLLSLFSNRNKKNLLINTANASEPSLFKTMPSKSSLITPISTTHVPISAASNMKFSRTELEHINIPEEFSVSSNKSIFSTNDVRFTTWNGKQWERVGKELSKLDIIETSENKLSMIIYTSNGGIQKAKLISFISNNWKCVKPTAQDIQIVLPNSSIVGSILPPKASHTITLRCREVERLMNTLDHCMEGNLPSSITERSISTSKTTETSSTTDSSYFSRSISKLGQSISDTSDSDTSEQEFRSVNQKDFKSALLLPSIKIKLHKLDGSNMWVKNGTGQVDVYLQKYQEVNVASKFEISFMNDNENYLDSNKIIFVSYLENIRRTGRTGLSFTDFASEEIQLLEFKNQVIADEVFKLILQQ